jgi:hypothetical protein
MRVSAVSCFEVSSRHYQRMIGIVWPRVDGQHVFHRGYERAVRLRRDNPALSAMGLEDFF